jgi:N-acetylglutamate synthase-like GNAT family acetyltransferase
LSIRPSKSTDVDAVYQLINDTIDACYNSVYPQEAVNFFKYLYAKENIKLHQENDFMVIAECDNCIIATGVLKESKKSGRGEIIGVYVRHNFQRRGYGRLIMKALEDGAVAHGYDRLILGVSITLYDFYVHLGYDIIKKRSQPVDNGQVLEYWIAVKNLKNRITINT